MNCKIEPIVIEKIANNLDVSSVVDSFSKIYSTTFTTRHAKGWSIIWMTTKEPLFVMTPSGSQKTPVLVTVTVTTHS